MALTLKIGTAGSEVDLTQYLIVNSLRVEQRADAFVSTCSFQLIDKDADVALAFSFREKDSILIADGATKYFSGTIANVDQDVLAEGDEALISTTECQDYNLLVEEVVIDQVETYGATLDSAIIDDLFDKYLPEIDSHGPGGGGYVESLHVFDEIEFVDISLREALDRIASEVESTALAGYWYIDFDKYLHYYNLEDNAPAWYLSDTPDQVTSFSYLSDISRSRQGSSIANRILVVGAEMALFVQDYDSYNYYGKWFEAVVNDNTLFSVDEVLAHGYALLAKWAYPDEVFTIRTRKEGLRAGMNVRFENGLFGTEVKTNLVENPSFEVNVADFWTFAQDGVGGSAAQSAVRAAVGAQSCLITASNAGDAEQWSDIIALADDETMTVQARVYRPTAITCSIMLWDSTNGASRATLSADITAGWQILTTSWKNELGGAVNVRLVLINGAGDGTSEVWFDGCMAQIDKGPYSLDYIDGTFPFCSWSGAAHNSTSSRLPVFTVRELALTWPENTLTFELTLGGKVSATSLISSRSQSSAVQRGLGPVVPGQLPVSSRGWSHNLVFVPAANPNEHNKLDWGAGTITAADGTVYSIVAGTTGIVAAPTYIYLDTDTSLTVLQTTGTASAAVGRNMVLVAIMEDVAVDPDADVTQDVAYKIFGGGIPSLITANEIVANAIETGNIKAGAITTEELFALSVTAAKIAANTITADKLAMGMGDSLYNAADGLLLFGPNCEINATEWWTLRRQIATISGAFRQTAGYWPGSRALAVEIAATNLVLNPSFEVNVTDLWNNLNWATAEQSDTEARSGSYSARLYDVSCGANENFYTDFIAVGATTDYTLTIWIKKTICTGTGLLYINWHTAGDVYISNSGVTLDSGTHDWKRYTITAESPATAAKCSIYLDSNGVTAATELEIYVDAVQLEASDYGTPYFDGTFGTGYAWTGDAHNSTSTRTATEVNLDDHVALISGNNTLSFRCVVQMPYDADATWPTDCGIFDIRGADTNSRILLRYDLTNDDFRAYINGAWRITNGSVQTFDAGDWLDMVLTLDFTNDLYYLYVNGLLYGSDATALTAPTLTEWNIGSLFNGTLQCGLSFTEFVVFDRVLTAIEVAALYALGKPTVDLLPMDAPGIYILDGRFRIASSLTGNRIEMTANGIQVYDSAGVEAVGLTQKGLRLRGTSTTTLHEIHFEDADEYVMGKFLSNWGGGTNKAATIITAERPTGAAWPTGVRILLRADDIDIAGEYCDIWIYSEGGVSLGPIAGGAVKKRFEITGDISQVFSVDSDGSIQTRAASVAWWRFGTADSGVAGMTSPDYKLHFEVDGSWYTVLAEAGKI